MKELLKMLCMMGVALIVTGIIAYILASKGEKDRMQNEEDNRMQIREIISDVNKECKHKWVFIKGGFWSNDKFICKRCASYNKIW